MLEGIHLKNIFTLEDRENLWEVMEKEQGIKEILGPPKKSFSGKIESNEKIEEYCHRVVCLLCHLFLHQYQWYRLLSFESRGKNEDKALSHRHGQHQ